VPVWGKKVILCTPVLSEDAAIQVNIAGDWSSNCITFAVVEAVGDC